MKETLYTGNNWITNAYWSMPGPNEFYYLGKSDRQHRDFETWFQKHAGGAEIQVGDLYPQRALRFTIVWPDAATRTMAMLKWS
jgi:hypothetical protein